MPIYYGSLITETINPFARGTGNVATLSTGVQYGATVSSAGSTAFANVESITVPLPINAMVTQLEIGLTAGLLIKSTTTDTISLRCLVQDSGQTAGTPTVTTAADIVMASTAGLTASSAAATDYTFNTRVTPSTGTYFTGRGSFVVVPQIASSATTSNAAGAIKSSSYLTYKYYLVA